MFPLTVSAAVVALVATPSLPFVLSQKRPPDCANDPVGEPKVTCHAVSHQNIPPVSVIHDASHVISEIRALFAHGEPPVIFTCPVISSFAHGEVLPIPIFQPVS